VKPRFVLAGSLLLLAALFLVISETGAAANDSVWYGLLALFVLSQVIVIAYFVTRRRD